MKITKKKLGFILLTFLLVIGFFIWALREMEIEDHYGDLQDLFFKSKTGDVLIMGNFDKVGIVHRYWTRIELINTQKDTMGLYHWVYDDRYPETSIALYKMNEEDILREWDDKTLRLIIDNKVFKRAYFWLKKKDDSIEKK